MTRSKTASLPKLGAPAHRALDAAGIRSLEELTPYSEDQIRRLHGIGPNALVVLSRALKEHGLSFKEGAPRDTITDLNLIFSSLKGLLEAYRPPLVAKVETNRRFDLASIKDVVIAGRKRSEIYFASAIIQKGYVGFYFMPVYTTPEMKGFFAPELLSLLKGKSCFHIKKLDKKLLAQIRKALKDGYKLYKSRQWV